jgi:hypothetical protein
MDLLFQVAFVKRTESRGIFVAFLEVLHVCGTPLDRPLIREQAQLFRLQI